MHAWRAEDVRAYLARDWRALDAGSSPRDPATAVALAGELRAQALASVPGWPSPEDREADLACHVRLAAIFERAHRAQLRRARAR